MTPLATIAAAALLAAVPRGAGTPGMIDLCELRQLPGAANTLNPHDRPDRRRQETVRVCIETLPDGRLPPRPPFRVTVERKPWSIA